MFYSLTKLSAPVQQVLYQMKIVTTAGLLWNSSWWDVRSGCLDAGDTLGRCEVERLLSAGLRHHDRPGKDIQCVPCSMKAAGESKCPALAVRVPTGHALHRYP